LHDFSVTFSLLSKDFAPHLNDLGNDLGVRKQIITEIVTVAASSVSRPSHEGS
jgi:hypothetical protein